MQVTKLSEMETVSFPYTSWNALTFQEKQNKNSHEELALAAWKQEDLTFQGGMASAEPCGLYPVNKGFGDLPQTCSIVLWCCGPRKAAETHSTSYIIFRGQCTIKTKDSVFNNNLKIML